MQFVSNIILALVVFVHGGMGARVLQSSAIVANAHDSIQLKSSASSSATEMQLFIKSLTGQTYPVYVELADTIDMVIARLYGTAKFADDFDGANTIYLIVGGTPLNRKRTVEYYKLQTVAAVHVIARDDWIRAWPLTIQNMDGSRWGTVDVKYEEKIGSVLTKVWSEEYSRTGALEVNLFVDGEKMNHRRTVGWYQPRNRVVRIQVGRRFRVIG